MQTFEQKFIYNFVPNREELRKMQLLDSPPWIDTTLMEGSEHRPTESWKRVQFPATWNWIIYDCSPGYRFKVVPKISFQIFHLLQGRLNPFLSGGMPKILKSSSKLCKYYILPYSGLAMTGKKLKIHWRLIEWKLYGPLCKIEWILIIYRNCLFLYYGYCVEIRWIYYMDLVVQLQIS
jgi:hypothetical protein